MINVKNKGAYEKPSMKAYQLQTRPKLSQASSIPVDPINLLSPYQ